MDDGLVLSIVFPQKNLNAGAVWEVCYKHILELNIDIKDFNKRIKPISLGKKLNNLKYFHIRYDQFSFQLAKLGSYDCSILYVSDFSKQNSLSIQDLVLKINASLHFSQAWLADASFAQWQNTISIDSYKFANKCYKHLATKSNDLPYPLTEIIIDISKNPGRNVFCHQYIEAIGSNMWFNDSFWEIIDSDKNAIIKEFSSNYQLLENNLIFFKFSENVFDEQSDVFLQDRIRYAIYYS